MSRYDTYFLMKPEDVPGYVLEKKPALFPPDADFECREIGDGNINYVFRLLDRRSGKSVIAKQAGVETRISKDIKLSTDRGRIEATLLGMEEGYAPGLVPQVYLYDPVMCVMLMEDMVGHSMMRTALLRHEIFPKFADHITTFMANTLLLTTDVVLNHKEKKRLVGEFINPDLCEISEDLVYTEPYNDRLGRNPVFPPNLEFVRKELYGDRALALEAAKLKFEFMNNAQALIHGDLHTGSIFINKEHTFVFDPEFAFFGPIGYDVGNIVANMCFAWANADATMPPGSEKDAYAAWVESAITEIPDLFVRKFSALFRERAADPMAETPGFFEWYLGTVLADTAGVCGLELNRRTVGMATVKDLITIPDADKRKRAERIMIFLAKDCIMNRASFTKGGDYLAALRRAVAKTDEYRD